MRLFFMGTPQIAVPVLQQIIESKHEVVLVITQPDKPVGRQRKLTAPPIKILAQQNSLPVVQPQTLKDEKLKKQLESLKPDVGIVFAYGKIIPQWLLNLPKYGVINIHASLLPRWRGAAPIQRAIMAGDKVTGVTIMQMVAELDAGDILLQQEIPIEPDDTAGTLEQKISYISGPLLIKALDAIEKETISPIKQDQSQVTYAEKISEEDTEIDWNKPAEEIANQIRALNPKPGARTHFNGLMVKIWRAKAVDIVPDLKGEFKPGTVAKIDKQQGPYIATGNGFLLIQEIQPENKKKMSGAEFIRGFARYLVI